MDTTLNVIAVETVSGTPLATVWNFAIHGICFDAPNLKASADVMGAVNRYIESKAETGVSMFLQADEGDVNPIFSVACKYPEGTDDFSGGLVIGDAVIALRKQLTPTSNVRLTSSSHFVEFGPTQLNLTLARVDNCTRGGPLDICTLCDILDCDANIHLPSSWVEESARFTALDILNGESHILVSIPGEALTSVGFNIRKDIENLGYNGSTALLVGLANNHLGYIAGPVQYDRGDYESILTFFGRDTSLRVRKEIQTAVAALK